jgi:hypothetical protein
MANQEHAGSNGSEAVRQLNSWKAIAAYLGKGVRTVQRWERDYGLPVRRVGRGGTEVYAFPAEIDAWRDTEASRRAFAGKGDSAERTFAPVADAATPATEAVPTAARGFRAGRPLRRAVLIAGTLVLVAVAAAGAWLVVAVKDALRFGDGKRYPPPFLVLRAFVTRMEDGRKALWGVSVQFPEFPCALERLDARTGAPLSQYWSSGYITSIVPWTFHGRSVVLVGGQQNERWSSSLAVLDAANPSGTSPAELPKYRCDTCSPATPPLAFLSFPQPPEFAPLQYRPGVMAIVPDEANGINVQVAEAMADLDGAPRYTVVNYSLGPDLRLIRAEPADGYVALYDHLVRVGMLPGSFPRERVGQGLAPLVRWDRTRFVAQ